MRALMVFTIIVMSPSLVIPASADPAQTAGSDQSVSPSAQTQEDPNEIVCRPGHAVTGTRIPGPRECHTRRDWDQMRKDSQQQLSTYQEQGLLGAKSDK